MIFKTLSGSAYEVDATKLQIRRLYGALEPTARTGQDGAWKPYVSLSDVAVGHPVLIHWANEEPKEAGALPGTLTSPVVEILQTSGLN